MTCLAQVKKNIQIKEYESLFQKQVVELANRSFGKNYLTDRKLQAYIALDPSFFIALSDTGLLGYCLFLSESAELAAQGLKVSAQTLRQLGGERTVCHTKSMSVCEEARGSGLAAELFHTCLTHAASKGAGSAWGTAWKIGEKVPMERIFRGEGF